MIASEGIEKVGKKVGDFISGAVKKVGKDDSGSKLQEVCELAYNYKLNDEVFNNHIVKRHGANSTYKNKSHFKADKSSPEVILISSH